jgi:hypothetical protein
MARRSANLYHKDDPEGDAEGCPKAQGRREDSGRIFRKLGLQTDAELACYAIREGIITLWHTSLP